MRATLFVDVDGVLTIEAANMQLARQLGVQDTLEGVERDYSNGRIDTDEFGSRLVRLFRDAKLTEELAKEHCDRINLRVGAKRLLGRDCVYLVSSGPSYFVEPLARKFGIPPDRVLCSKYEFDPGHGGLIRACADPVGQVSKAEFVKARVPKGNLSVGIGDTPEVDSQFLSHCTVKVLIGEWRNEYVCVRDLTALNDLIEGLESLPAKDVALPDSGRKVRAFIGSSSEGKETARAIQVELEDQGKGRIEATVWSQNEGSIGDTVIDNLVAATGTTDFAVLVLSPDDMAESRQGHFPVPRDNVIFECGLFLGALGKGRVFLVTTGHDSQLKIPSDLGGVIYKHCKTRDDGNITASVAPACLDIFKAMGSPAPARSTTQV